MQCALSLHPDYQPGPVTAVTVAVTRPAADRLCLRYNMTGEIDAVALPDPTPATRSDELWRHTCFELFVRQGDGYDEYNFSPSRAFAVYGFAGYRSGMHPLADITPEISISRGSDYFCLEALVATPRLQPGVLRLGLSAVTEDRSGAIGYWALAHAPGKPDFHHDTAFAMEL